MQPAKPYDYRRGAIEMVDASTGLMRCSHCGASWMANTKPGGGTYRGTWTCRDCGANTKSRYEPSKVSVEQ